MSALRLVETRGQQAWTTSEIVAEGCELSHRVVIRLVRKYRADFEELGRLNFESSKGEALPQGGYAKPTEYAVLSEDHATYLITLFRNSPIVRRFKLALVKAFRRALNQISRDFASPPRRNILTAKRQANRPMLDALVEAREEAGKTTDERHFMCESRLCNWALTGRFEKLDERTLGNADAVLLEQVRDRNRSLLVAGLDYASRKDRLRAFALRQRTRLIAAGADAQSTRVKRLAG